MADEVIEFLQPVSGDVIVDGTVGEGGHSLKLAEKITPKGLLIIIDRDKDNLEIARKRLSDIKTNFKPFVGSYSGIKDILEGLSVNEVDGVLLDLGFSMRHIFDSKKGFSFSREEILDMRYDTSTGIPAYQWLNTAGVSEIARVLRKYGQEEEALYIAKAIVRFRKEAEIKTSTQLAEIVTKTKRRKKKKVHPATKTFQAIRIHINREFDELEKGLRNSVKVIKKGGRLAVLTYHSLEDRIVKDFLLEYSGRKCTCPSGLPVCKCGAEKVRPMVKIPKASGSRPSQEEIDVNPAARSAHLRGCEVVLTDNE
jgi:16S rRNA (cytosine1402-N4)-methyltransferase